MGKKRSFWKKSEEPETPPVEALVEKKTSKDYYTQQKERFLADERLGRMDDERKKMALGKFFDTYGVPYVQGSGISDKEQLDRFRQKFIDENITGIPEPKKKDKDVPGFEIPDWRDIGKPSEDDKEVKPPLLPPSVEKEEAARKAMGLATGVPAIIKAPPPGSSPEAIDTVAKDPRVITPQGPNESKSTSTVKEWVELAYVEKDWPSPMNKIKRYYEGAAELQRDVQAGKMDEAQYTQELDDLAQEIGLGRKENGDMFIFPNEVDLYKGELEKQYRSYLDRTGEKEKDSFVKDLLQQLSIGSADVINTVPRMLATAEGLSNQLIKLVAKDREDVTYWKDRAALESEIIDWQREDNRRYDESITEMLRTGENGKAALQTALSAAEALPRLSILALGNAYGATNITLGWMGGDKAVQEYMRTENDPNMTKFIRGVSAMSKGFSEMGWERFGTVTILNNTRRAIREMGEDVVRKEMRKAYTPFFQRQMAIWDKGLNAATREGMEEFGTSITDDIVDVASGTKTFDQIGETALDEAIVGFAIGFGMGSPQMIAESGGKSKYVKNIAKTIPEDFDTETKLAMASMIVKYDQLRYQMNEAPEAMKETYKEQMAHTQDLINDMMARGEFVPTKVAPTIQTFVEGVKDGTVFKVAPEIKKAGDILAEQEKKAAEKPVAKPKEEVKPPVEEKPVEKPKPEKEPVTKELTDEQKAHNNLVAKVRSYNALPTQNTAQRSKAMGPITKIAQQLGYGLNTVKGKLVALSDKGKRIKTVSLPGVYRSLKEVEDPKFQKFTNEFLEDENMITNLGIQLYGKKLRKAREDLIGEKKNQASDQLLGELERMYNNGYIEIREADETRRIPVADIETLMEEPKLIKFIEEHGALDATNIDQALEAGLINQEDYETTKQQLEAEITQRAAEEAEPEPAVEEDVERPPDIEGKKPEGLEVSEKEPTSTAMKNILKAGEDTFTREMTIEGERVGEITVEETEDAWSVKRVDVEPEHQRKGIATETYRDLNKQAEAEGVVVRSDRADKINESSRKLWESLVKSEDAIKLEDGSYVMKNKNLEEQEVKKPEIPEKLRTLAENIRKAKIETEGAVMGTLPLFPQAWNFSVEAIATAIEGGAAVVDAINIGIAKLKEQEFFKKLNAEDQKKMEDDVRARFKEDYGVEEKQTEAAAMTIEDEDVVMEKPTTKAPPKKKIVEKPAEERTGEEISREKLQKRIDARRTEINRINALKQGEARKILDEHFVDVNEPFKKAIIKEGGEGALKFVNRMNLEAGAPARAKALIQEAQKKIFGKGFRTMSKNQQEFLSEVVDLIRAKELDDLYTKRGQKLLKHENGTTGKDAEVGLKDFQNKAPWILEKFGLKDYDPDKIMKSINAYHQVMRDNLTKLYENGIIGEAAYNKFKDEQPYYSPRRYIEHMDEIDPNGAMSGIRALQGGSVGQKVVDLNTLMSDAVARTEGLVSRNIKMQSSTAYATETESAIIRKAPFTKDFKEKLKQRKEMEEQGELFEGMAEMQIYLEPEFEQTPKGMTPVDYFDNGNRHRVWIESDLYEYFDYAPADERTEMALHGLSLITGVPILKLFATGLNPEFAFKNLPIDALHAWMTDAGREYSWFMPAAMAQMSADYATVAKDAWTKKGRYRDYINEGGGMDFLATQGTEILSRYKRYTKWTSSVGMARDGMAKIGEFSETMTRLAIRERYINNRLDKAKKEGKELTEAEMKSLQEDGTAFARNYLDFSQGGKTAKLIDKFIPYFNAGVQVTRGSLRAAWKNPGLFSAKILQITGLATLLTAWNMGDMGDDEEGKKRRKAYLDDVNDQVKARNFVIMTNIKYIDNANRERYRYFKIPKDALQSNITSLAEDMYIKMFHDGAYKLMNNKMWTAMNNEFRNITDLSNLPPIYRAGQGYKQNYDSFYESEIWTGREQPESDLSREFYEGVTPPRYIKFGDITKGSPVRSQYFAKQFFTEGNLYGSILGEFFDGLATGFKGADEKYINEAWEKIQRDPPGLRRIMKSTFPKPLEEMEEAQKEYNKIKTINDQRFNKLVGKKSLKDIDDKAIHNFLEETGARDGVYEYERMIDKFTMRAKTEGINPAVIQLKWYPPEIRALGFHKMLKDNPENSTELWKQAEKAGIRSERFNQEVGRLITMDKTEPEK